MERASRSRQLLAALWAIAVVAAPARAGGPAEVRAAEGITEVTEGATTAAVAVRSLQGELIVESAERVLIELVARPVFDHRAGSSGNSQAARLSRASAVASQHAQLARDLAALD